MPTKCKLVYLRPASDDFQEIVKFHINEVGVQSARKIYVTMRDAINKLADFPLMGQIHPDPMLAADNYRKLVLTRTDGFEVPEAVLAQLRTEGGETT